MNLDMPRDIWKNEPIQIDTEYYYFFSNSLFKVGRPLLHTGYKLRFSINYFLETVLPCPLFHKYHYSGWLHEISTFQIITDLLVWPANFIRFLWISVIAPVDINNWLLCSLKGLDDAGIRKFHTSSEISEIKLVSRISNLKQNLNLDYQDFRLKRMNNIQEMLSISSFFILYALLLLLFGDWNYIAADNSIYEDILNDLSSAISADQLPYLDFFWGAIIGIISYLISLYLLPATVIKLLARFFTYKFIDSICALEALRISVLLNESEDLLLLDMKRDISRRIEYLSKICLLLPNGYQQGIADQR
ncbi:MAG: hypothetical protein ACFB0E_08560 [Leptolyngbyaceae cyanobacterium]